MTRLRLLVLWAILGLLSRAQAECDQCKFDGGDAADCRVYGQLGDDELIPWQKASPHCLDFYDIKSEGVDPDQLVLMFPNSDGSGGRPSAFVDWLRFNSGSVVSGIKLGFQQFWDETDTGAVELLPMIIALDGTVVDCDASQSSCYNAIKASFSAEPLASEMADVGRDLYDLQAFDREKEQAFVRIRLCEEGPNPAVCGGLSDQVHTIKSQNPDSFCSAFALGPGTGTVIPGCGDDATPTQAPTSSCISSSKTLFKPLFFLSMLVYHYL